MAAYDLTKTKPEKIRTGDILNCPYSGVAVQITLPPGKFKLECWGAQGGSYSSYYGGAGGYSAGELELLNPTDLFLYAGGQPETISTNRTSVPGGFNGGGDGYNRYYSSTYTYGQGGGGASDIRIGQDSLYARVIVAGGGGGSASVNALTTKFGGGTSGGAPQSGYGASQTTAGTNGSFGQGGFATTSGNNYKYGSGGGGGGWYGGGACSSYSDSTNYRGYNGGGSGFVWEGNNAPDGYLLTAAHYLSTASTLDGAASFTAPGGGAETGHTGNGYVRITVLEITPQGPDAPQNFRQTSKDYFSIGLAWDAVDNASGYRLYRDGVLIAAITGTTYTDSNVQPNGSYIYAVKAYNDDGESDSTVITAKTSEGYVVTLPVIQTAFFSVNPADINVRTVLSVTVTEEMKILQPEVWYSGELYSGEG